MFEATFMGWQGWLLRSGETRILVDPLLVDAVGRGTPETRQRFVTWPPRTFDWQHFPAIDGLFLSHEHEDHFNIASLARIDRSVPVWMSAWSSVAARTALEELGFELRLLGPEQQIELGELSLRSFGADHRQGEQQDEWDTLAYELSSAEGRFFTNVDVRVTAAMREQLLEQGGPPLSFVGMGLSLGLPAGAEVRVRFDGHPEPLAGAVTMVAPEVDAATRLILAELEFDSSSSVPTPRVGAVARVEFARGATPAR